MLLASVVHTTSRAASASQAENQTEKRRLPSNRRMNGVVCSFFAVGHKQCSPLPPRASFSRGLSLLRLSAGLTLFIASLTAPAQNASQQTPGTAPQVERVLPSYEGQPVVAVEIAGRPGIDADALKPLLTQKEGEPFSRAKIDQTIAALKSSPAVKAKDVELEVRPDANGLRVMFVLQPAAYFGIYTFPGAGRFAYSRLLQVADYPPRGAYSTLDVEQARHNLQQFFQKSGYFEVQINPELQTDKVHGLVSVNYRIQLHRRARFGKVVFDGAPRELEPDLQKALKSWKARLRGTAIRPGKTYSLQTVQKAPLFLEARLISKDYFGSRVQLSNAEYDRSTNRADLSFKVTVGPRVHVSIQGAHVWSWTRRKLLPIYEQAGLDPELIQEGRQNLISYFQSKGYFDASVTTQSGTSNTEATLTYVVNKGQRHKVEAVRIAGNQHLPDTELKGHVTVEKAGLIPIISHGKFSDQLVRDSVKNLERVYQAEGFSTVKVTPQVAKNGGNIVTVFHVEEGPQDIVDVLHVVGNQRVPETTLVPTGMKVVAGQAYSAKRVDDDRNQILAQYLRLGYLNANFRATAHKVNGNSHRLDVTYEIEEGPKVIIDSVLTLGARSTKQSLIDQTVRLNPETPLREDELLLAENRLYKLGIFDWAEIDPQRQITTQTDENVVVKLHESQENELRYGFGFEVINRGGSIPSGTVAVPGIPPTGLPSGFRTSQKTFWGPRGTFQYTRRNFRGQGESVNIGLLAARLIQRAAFAYADPFFVGANWSATSSLSVERSSENPIFTSRIGDFGFQVQRMLNAAETKTLTLRYGFRYTSLTGLLIPDLVPPEDRKLHLSTLSASYSFDTRDNPLDATKGKYDTADFDLNLKGIGSSVNFARLRAQVARYKELGKGKGIIWANSLRIGIAQPFLNSRVPVSELFFSGGGSTLRGFPLNGAGPQRDIAVCSDPNDPNTCSKIAAPSGGRELFILNSEVRIPLPIRKGLGVVAFYDGGNVFQHVGFGGFSTNYSNTLGVGLRYKTPVGPVRIDLGHNLNSPAGIKATQIFITLGQAF
jgi:outer membrane protein assembly factor BamA